MTEQATPRSVKSGSSKKSTAGRKVPGKVGRPKNPPAVNADVFLPARRADLYQVDNAFDMDALHWECWERRDARNNNKLDRRPYDDNQYVLANGIAQGRWRRQGKGRNFKYYVKDPEQWEAEAVDFRGVDCGPGEVRCNFCGFKEPMPAQKYVACKTCLVLLGLDPYAESD